MWYCSRSVSTWRPVERDRHLARSSGDWGKREFPPRVSSYACACVRCDRGPTILVVSSRLFSYSSFEASSKMLTWSKSISCRSSRLSITMVGRRSQEPFLLFISSACLGEHGSDGDDNLNSNLGRWWDTLRALLVAERFAPNPVVNIYSQCGMVTKEKKGERGLWKGTWKRTAVLIALIMTGRECQKDEKTCCESRMFHSGCQTALLYRPMVWFDGPASDVKRVIPKSWM